MSGLSVSGIASGIDSQSIISQMVSLETKSIAKFQRRIALEEAERLTFEDLSGRLQSLKTAVSGFSSSELFSSLSASSSDEDVLSVTARDSAPRGSHQVKVMQVAQAHRIGGTGVTDPIGTRLAAGFTKTDFDTGTTLSSVARGSKNIENSALSTFDYESNVTLSGQYNGTDNVDISVELLSDVTDPNGTVDLRISTDGVNFKTFNGVNISSGKISLNSATYFGSNGVSLSLDHADATMKTGDTFSFRVRGQASIEYTVGDGERKELLLGSDTTLAELVSQVNGDKESGLRADILNDGSASNSYRLLLTSLTEGSSGEIDLLHNDSVIKLSGVSAESPVAKSNSYTGVASVAGSLSAGSGNTSLVIEMIQGGALGAAKFKISADGGLTFHDNNGAGFDLGTPDINGDYHFDLDSAKADDGSDIFSNALDIDLKLTDDGSLFTKGDRVTIDLFDAEVQSAQDALINVDGITLVKSSNTIDDVFEGLTLNLKDASPNQTIKVEVNENVGDVAAVVTGFVEAYNSAMSLIHAQSKFNPEEDSEAPLLMGDATVRRIQYSLQNFITGTRSRHGNGPSSLAELGVTTDSKTGQLNFDSAKLSEALNSDPEGVRRLLSSYGESLSGSGAAFAGNTSATKAGTYSIKVSQARTRAEVSGEVAKAITSLEQLTIRVNSDAQGSGNIRAMTVDLTAGMSVQQQVSAIQNAFDRRDLAVTASLEDGKIVVRHHDYGDDYKIEITSDKAAGDSGFKSVTRTGIGTDLEGTINGISAEVSGDTLIGKKGYGFEGLRVRITNDFSGDAGQIGLSEGIGKGFADLLDSFIGFGGLLSDKIDSFDSTISRFEEQMNRVTERATRLEDRLRQQFVNLEVTLGRLNSTGEYLVAQLKSLPGVQLKK